MLLQGSVFLRSADPTKSLGTTPKKSRLLAYYNPSFEDVGIMPLLGVVLPLDAIDTQQPLGQPLRFCGQRNIGDQKRLKA